MPSDSQSMGAAVRSVRAALAVLALCACTAVGLGCGKSPATAPIVLPPLSQVVLSLTVDTLSTGEVKTFTATALDTNGTPVAGATFSWSSSNEGVFSVSSIGRVTSRGEGTATLTASAGGLSDQASITVLPGGGWIVQTSNTSANLNGVFFQPDGRRGWAVGSGGRIVHTADAGVTWTNQTSNTALALNSVWFTGANTGWAVGDNGTVRKTTNGGTTWQIIVTGAASEDLFDVTFAHPDTGWIVGATGVVLRTVDGGASWQRKTPSASSLHSVAFFGTRDGWAVGNSGTIIGTHDRGDTWFTVTPAVTAQNLLGVSRWNEPYAWAVGDVGAAPRTFSGPDSTQWTLTSAGAGNQLGGVHFPAMMTGFAVGFNTTGIVLRSDDGGANWTQQTSNTQFRLNDVFFIDEIRGWAVGNNGAIVHTAYGGLPRP